KDNDKKLPLIASVFMNVTVQDINDYINAFKGDKKEAVNKLLSGIFGTHTVGDFLEDISEGKFKTYINKEFFAKSINAIEIAAYVADIMAADGASERFDAIRAPFNTVSIGNIVDLIKSVELRDTENWYIKSNDKKLPLIASAFMNVTVQDVVDYVEEFKENKAKGGIKYMASDIFGEHLVSDYLEDITASVFQKLLKKQFFQVTAYKTVVSEFISDMLDVKGFKTLRDFIDEYFGEVSVGYIVDLFISVTQQDDLWYRKKSESVGKEMPKILSTLMNISVGDAMTYWRNFVGEDYDGDKKQAAYDMVVDIFANNTVYDYVKEFMGSFHNDGVEHLLAINIAETTGVMLGVITEVEALDDFVIMPRTIKLATSGDIRIDYVLHLLDVYLAEFSNLTRDESTQRWSTNRILHAVYNTKVSSIVAAIVGVFILKDRIKNLDYYRLGRFVMGFYNSYLSDRLGSTIDYEEVVETNDEGEEIAYWIYHVSGNFKTILEITLNISIREIKDLVKKLSIEEVKDFLREKYGETTIGDYLFDLFRRFIAERIKCEASGFAYEDYVMSGPYSKVLKALFGIKIFDIYDYRSTLKAKILMPVFGNFQVGDVAGYLLDKESGKWLSTGGNEPFNGKGFQAIIFGRIFNIYLRDLLNFKSFNFMSIFDGLKIGELMGYTETDGEWYNASGKKVSAIERVIANVEISSIISGNFNINEILGDLKLGEIMNYVAKEEDGKTVWYKSDGETKVSAIEQKLANIVMSTILSGGLDVNSVIGDLQLGEIMGYTEEDGVWMKKNGTQASAIEQKLAGVVMSTILSGNFDINSIIGDLELGEIMSYVAKEEDGKTVWYKSDGETKVSVIEQKLAGIKMQTILTGGLDINSTIGDILLGEIMGYVAKEEDGKTVWYKGDGVTKASAIEQKLAEVVMADILGGDFNVNNVIGTLQLGEVMGYTETDGVWYNNGNKVAAIEQKLANIVMSDILSGTFSASTMLEGLKLGEAMDATKEGNVWTDKNGNAVESVILNRMYDIDLGKMISTGGLDLDTILRGVYLGEVLGYDAVYTERENGDGLTEVTGKYYDKNHNELTEEYTYYVDANDNAFVKEDDKYYAATVKKCNNGEHNHVLAIYKTAKKWKQNGNDASVINDHIAMILMTDILSGDMDIISSLSDIEMGDLMGYVKCTEDDECPIHGAGGAHDGEWYKWDSNSSKYVAVSVLDGRIAGIDMNAVLNGKLDITGTIGDIFVGDLMGYDKDEYKTKDAAYFAANNITLTAMVDSDNQPILSKKGDQVYRQGSENVFFSSPDGQTYTCVKQIGETKKEYVEIPVSWKDGGTSVSGLNSIIANIALGSVLSGDTSMADDLKEDIKGLKLNEVIDLGDSKVLNLLGNTEIGNLSTAMNNLTVGEIMGYKKIGDKWYEADETTEVTDNMTLVMADYKISELSSSGFTSNLIDDIKNKLTIGDIFTGENYTGPISLIPADTKIGNISSTLSARISTATLSELITAGVLPSSMFAAGTPMSILKNYETDKNNDGEITDDEKGYNVITLTNMSLVLTEVIKDSTIGELYDCGLLPVNTTNMHNSFGTIYNSCFNPLTAQSMQTNKPDIYNKAVAAKNNTANDNAAIDYFWRSLTLDEMISCVG
ncbi:MAG: hypothetical protein IJ706_03915, partial [Clostridia bacterium]|nr:hypothetical protein [Clostridia bacterium]